MFSIRASDFSTHKSALVLVAKSGKEDSAVFETMFECASSHQVR